MQLLLFQYILMKVKKLLQEIRIAGLNELRIINEPSCNCIWTIDQKFKSSKNIFIFDLGGYTFDVSVLKLEHFQFKVLAINGNTHLRGEDFDNELVKYYIEVFEKEKGILVKMKSKKKKFIVRILKKNYQQYQKVIFILIVQMKEKIFIFL